MNHIEHGHGVVVEPVRRIRIADALGDIACNLLHVNIGLRVYLPADEHQRLTGECLRRNVAFLVLPEAFVEDAVAYLVAKLIGVPLPHRLRGKKIMSVLHKN